MKVVAILIILQVLTTVFAAPGKYYDVDKDCDDDDDCDDAGSNPGTYGDINIPDGRVHRVNGYPGYPGRK